MSPPPLCREDDAERRAADERRLALETDASERRLALESKIRNLEAQRSGRSDRETTRSLEHRRQPDVFPNGSPYWAFHRSRGGPASTFAAITEGLKREQVATLVSGQWGLRMAVGTVILQWMGGIIVSEACISFSPS